MTVSSGYLTAVKTRLRITTTTFDTEITSHINAAREDLIRLGVRSDVAEDETNMSILAAIRAYTLWRFSSDDTLAERSRRDYNDMRDELRRHVSYRIEDEDETS